MLKLENVSCSYGSYKVIENISLTLDAGKFYCIVGVNGSGKTTLLNSIANLHTYTGKIYLNNKSVKTMKSCEIAKHMAYFRQSPALSFPYNVYDTLMLARYAHMQGIIKRPTKNDDDIVRKVIKQLNLHNYQNRNINTLSGGQKQRVFLAKALCQQANILLLDEPTNNLDLKYQVEILDYIKDWVKTEQITVVAVLHDLNMVVRYADEVFLLNKRSKIHFNNIEDFVNSSLVTQTYDFDIKSFMTENHSKWL